MKKLILPTILIIFFSLSCNKEKDNDKITVSGKLVKDCVGTPYANESFAWLNSGKGFFEDREVVDFRTDSEGNFEVKVNAGPHGIPSEIRKGYSGGRPIIELDPESDLCLGTFNTSPTANYQLKVKINNTYNVGDTLIIGDQSGLKQYKFGHPFNDTTFAITYNYSHSINVPNISNKNSVPYSVYYKIYSGQPTTSSYSEKKFINFSNIFEGCSADIHPVEITID